MGEMKTATKTGLLLVGVPILLYAKRIHRLVQEEDIDIPEFMKPVTCSIRGCDKRAVPKVGKCVECAYEEFLPLLHDDLEDMLRPKKS
jgi:hypothetical protein